MVSALESHLGYWLRFVSNHVSHAFALALEARGVTVAEWVVLRELHARDGSNQDVAPSALAVALGMTRGAISKLVDRLAAKSLLVRSQGAGDRRYQQIGLTDAGRALVPELAALADANDARFFGHLSPAERTAIAAVMKDIVRRHGLRAIPID